MARLPAAATGAADGLGELEEDRGTSRLGRVEEVGVVLELLLRAWDELMRRERGVPVSRGVAIVDMLYVCWMAGHRLKLEMVVWMGGGNARGQLRVNYQFCVAQYVGGLKVMDMKL